MSVEHSWLEAPDGWRLSLLDLRPTGEVVVKNGTTEMLRTSYAPPSTALAVFYGRNMNRTEPTPNGAGIRDFAVE